MVQRQPEIPSVISRTVPTGTITPVGFSSDVSAGPRTISSRPTTDVLAALQTISKDLSSKVPIPPRTISRRSASGVPTVLRPISKGLCPEVPIDRRTISGELSSRAPSITFRNYLMFFFSGVASIIVSKYSEYISKPFSKIILSLLFVLAAGTTVPAAGQGITDSIFSISEVAVTHTTNFIKEQAGMKESTVDTLILRHQIHTDLSTLLAENSNIHIRDYGRGALSTASFRGTAPSHTQVSWNGLNINSPMLGMVDFSLVPVFIIDELNVHHGAASVASRSGGLGGEVEIRNLPDWSNKAGGRVYMDYGSFGTAGGMTQLNLGSTEFQSKTRFYRTGSENNYPFVNKNIIEKDSLTGELSHPIQENRNAAYLKTGATHEFYWRPTKRRPNRKNSTSHRNAPAPHNPNPEPHPPYPEPRNPNPATRTSQPEPRNPQPGNSILSNRTWLQAAERSVPTVMSSEYRADRVQRDNRQEDLTLKNVTEYNYYGEQTKVQLRSGIDYQQLGYT